MDSCPHFFFYTNRPFVQTKPVYPLTLPTDLVQPERDLTERDWGNALQGLANASLNNISEKCISTKKNKLETFYEKWPKDISPL